MAIESDNRVPDVTQRPILRAALSLLNTEDLKRHAGGVLTLGIVTMVLGVIALGHIWTATQVSVGIIGGVLFVAGVAEFFLAFASRQWSWFFLYLLGSVLSIVAGVFTMGNTTVAAVVLTAILATYLFVGGLFRMLLATALSPPSWGWIVLNGLIEVALGFMLWRQWPVSGVYAIGLFVGIDLISIGAT